MNPTKKLSGILGMAIGMQAIIEFNQENWKQEILDEWEKTKKLPRKKKKARRKELLLAWSIANAKIL